MPLCHHIDGREACPFLPAANKVIRPAEIRSERESGDPERHYLAALTCAQSLWLEGKPAQALLQLNHCLAIPLTGNETACRQWPLPYRAKVWLFTRRHEQGFLGNPTRHYQHLASRMSGPNKELRSWRAWACFHLAERFLPTDLFPRDQRQISKEKLQIPGWEQTLAMIAQLGTMDEPELLSHI